MDDHRVSLEKKLAVLESTLALQLEWVRGVDTKMQFLLTVQVLLLGAIAAVVPDAANFQWFPHGLWVAMGAVGLLASLGFCAFATIPRTRAPTRSLLFFGEIAKLSSSEFSAAVHRRSDEDLLADLVVQSHKNATLAAAKYWALTCAYWAFFGGLLGWFPAIYFLYRG